MPNNYVTLVNNAIEEAGADLASFASNGTDFNSTLVDPLMRKFKTWISRAWRDLQQESLDWQFMNSTAEVNIDPGFLFFTGNNTVDFSTYPPGLGISFYDQYDADSEIDVFDDPKFTGNLKHIYPMTTATVTGKRMGQASFYVDAKEQMVGTSTDMTNIFMKPAGLRFVTDDYYVFEIVGAFSSGQVNIFNDINTTPFDEDNPITVPEDSAYINLGIGGDGISTTFGLKILEGETGLISSIETLGVRLLVAVPSGAIGDFFLAGAPGQYNIFTKHGNQIRFYQSGLATLQPYSEVQDSYPGLTGVTHSWASYNFADETNYNDFVYNVGQINDKTFRFSAVSEDSPSIERPLTFIPWESFKNQYDFETTLASTPNLVTKDNTGRYRFFPPIDRMSTIIFDYQRNPQTLSAYNDTLTGLDDYYTDLVMWKAIMYYGEYDEQPSVYARAYKNYRNLLIRFEMQYREKFHFKPHRLY